MNAPHLATACAVLLLGSPPAFAGSPGFFSDPLVTHTNGMRLASTTSTRNHNVYWQCEAGHVGYCDGKLRSPCRDDWRSLGTRCHGQYVPPYTPMGPTTNETAHSMDGMEIGAGESLGSIATPGLSAADGRPAQRVPAPTAQVAPAATPPAGGQWIDAIQTIGEKMMAGQAG